MPDDDERAETKGGLPMDDRKGGWPWKVRIMIPALILLCLMCLQAQKNVDKWFTEEAAWRAGREYEFIAFDDEERGTYFLVFGDGTNGMETYDGGRFLDFKIDTGNQTVLNFNRAYNPPCAFTPFATCPLPPARNRFPFRLETGEKKYKGHD